MPEKLFRITYKQRFNEVECWNVLHFVSHNGLYTASQAASYFRTWFAPQIARLQTTTGKAYAITVKVVQGGQDETFEMLFSDLAGSYGIATIPTLASVVLTLRSGLAGRSNRGRMYLAGVPQGQTTANVLAATYVTRINESINAILPKFSHIDANPLHWVIYSKKLGEYVGVVSVAPQNLVGSQVRRKPGRGI